MKRKYSLEDYQYNPEEEFKKKSFTDMFFNLISHCSFLFTIINNSFWIYVLSKTQLGINVKDIECCSEAIGWNQAAYVYTTVILVKGIVSYTCFQCEEECRLICITFKSFTSFIPSLYFLFKMNNRLPISLITEKCEDILIVNHYFINFEYAYVIFILSIFCFIPLGALCAGLKEAWKGRSYKVM
jgi:hypothetical protein